MCDIIIAALFGRNENYTYHNCMYMNGMNVIHRSNNPILFTLGEYTPLRKPPMNMALVHQ